MRHMAGRAHDTEQRVRRLHDFLEQEVTPLVPLEERGRTLTREQEDEMLGYGVDGV